MDCLQAPSKQECLQSSTRLVRLLGHVHLQVRRPRFGAGGAAIATTSPQAPLHLHCAVPLHARSSERHAILARPAPVGEGLQSIGSANVLARHVDVAGAANTVLVCWLTRSVQAASLGRLASSTARTSAKLPFAGTASVSVPVSPQRAKMCMFTTWKVLRKKLLQADARARYSCTGRRSKVVRGATGLSAGRQKPNYGAEPCSECLLAIHTPLSCRPPSRFPWRDAR